jgi:hypothetical protein
MRREPSAHVTLSEVVMTGSQIQRCQTTHSPACSQNRSETQAPRTQNRCTECIKSTNGNGSVHKHYINCKGCLVSRLLAHGLINDHFSTGDKIRSNEMKRRS